MGCGISTESVFFVLGSTLLFVTIGFLLPLDRGVGVGLLLGLILYIWGACQQEDKSDLSRESSRSDYPPGSDGFNPKSLTNEVAAFAVRKQFAIPLALTLAGLVTLIVGGKLLVDGARGIALEVGVSETIIGLTIVAIGTSLPEMATCIIAALRRHGDVALGNILGSCVYNLLAISGVVAIISPTVIPAEIVNSDNLIMLAATVTMLLFLRSGTHIGRLQGALLVAAYVGYFAWIWPM